MRNYILSFALILFSISSFAALNGTWVNHSGMDIDSHLYGTSSYNHVAKMMETEKYVYILGNGKLHNNAQSGTKPKFPVVFILDKATEEITAPSTKFPASGQFVHDIAYSPASGTTAIVYQNLKVDLIKDNDEFIPSDALLQIIQPGGVYPRSVTFDRTGEIAYITTNFGFVGLDTTTGDLKEMVDLNTPLSFANKVGNYYVVYDDTSLYACDASTSPSSLDDFTLLNFSNIGTYGLAGIYPASDDTFIIPVTVPARNGLYIHSISLKEGVENAIAFNITSGPLHNSWMPIDARYVLADLIEGYVFPVPEGLMFASYDNFVKVPYLAENADFTSAEGIAAFKSILKSIRKDTATSGIAGAERYQKAVSRDGENYWIFRPRQGFIKRHADTSTSTPVWSNASEMVVPNVSAAISASYLTYHPDYGILARNTGAVFPYDEYLQSRYLSDGLSSFKDGKWERLSVFHRKFNVSGYLPLQWSPRGIVVDPCDPKMIYSVATDQGLLRSDITNPDVNLLLASEKDSNKAHSQFVAAIPYMQYPRAGITIPGFDKNGTLWMIPYCDPGKVHDEVHTELWYWPKEDRLAVNVPADYAEHPFKVIYIPGFSSAYQGKIYPLTGPGLENTIFLCSRKDNRQTFAYDHNGTLDDTSDDKICLFDNMIYPNGDEFPSLFTPYHVFEDPYDGNLLLTSMRGVMVINSKTLFNDKVIVDWLITDQKDSPDNSSRTIGDNGAIGIIADNLGRKWITTSMQGLYCLSPDRTEILGHFTTKNSPLPTDKCLDVAYNPERNSIIVGTMEGIMEFFPEGTSLPDGTVAQAPSVWPVSINPDFNGHITFRGLDDSKSYNLINETGEVIDVITPVNGQVDWHPFKDGKKISSGSYKLEGINSCSFIIL